MRFGAGDKISLHCLAASATGAQPCLCDLNHILFTERLVGPAASDIIAVCVCACVQIIKMKLHLPLWTAFLLQAPLAETHRGFPLSN